MTWKMGRFCPVATSPIAFAKHYRRSPQPKQTIDNSIVTVAAAVAQISLDEAGNMVGRSIFADLNEGIEPGIPDGG
jgi:hypothetical protein